jgi:hypothetical protein
MYRATQKHFVQSASQPVKAVALQYGAILLDPPPDAPGGPNAIPALLKHGYAAIVAELKGEPKSLELLVLLTTHAPKITGTLIDEGLEAMLARPELDSAVSVSPHRYFVPGHAQRLAGDGLLEPVAPSGPVADLWYPDWGVQILRPRLLDALKNGTPLPWLGKKVLPLKQWGGGPIDYQWQIPALEFWLKKQGLTDVSPSHEPKPQLKPQAAPKGDRR